MWYVSLKSFPITIGMLKWLTNFEIKNKNKTKKLKIFLKLSLIFILFCRIYVRKLSYFVTSKGKLQSPTSVKPPSLSVLQHYFNGKDSTVNKLYSGKVLVLYKNGLRLNIQDGDINKAKLRNSLNKAWDHLIQGKHLFIFL